MKTNSRQRLNEKVDSVNEYPSEWIELFKRLYSDCDGGQLEIRPLKPALPEKHFFLPNDSEGITAFIEEYFERDLYFGVSLRDGVGGGKENITHIPALWCDCDFKDNPAEIFAERISEFPLKPSAIIHSGGGVHLYWFLKEPSERSEIPAVESILKRIASYIGGDRAATDASRILRIPGTVNRKPERNGAKCEVKELTDFRYNLEDFNFLPELDEKTESPNASESDSTSDSSFPDDEIKKLVNKACKNNPKIKDLYKKGNWKDYKEYKSQSEADESLCCSFAYWLDRAPAAIDKAFRGSALYKAEGRAVRWDQKTFADGRTYGQGTIQKAIDYCKGKNTYQENRKKILENGIYQVEKGALCHNKTLGDGEHLPIPLCNFDARITEEIEKDDSIDRTIIYRISGKTQSGINLPEIDVPASQFSSMNFVAQWGAQANIYAGQGKKEHLRAAIQTLSIADEIPKRTIYTHLGWRKINDKWFYLSCNGAIGADGLRTDIEVRPDSAKFEAYVLPSPDGDLSSAVKASLRILDIADRTLSVPLIASVYRAVLNELSEVDYSIFFSGHTGVFKTELAALMQSHFGTFHSRKLPEGWNSTANALEKSAFTAKDAIMVIDDFCPRGSMNDVRKQHTKAEFVLRGVANHTPRGRLTAEAGSRKEHNPRCLAVSTGEDIPKGQSLRARMLILEIEKGAVKPEILSECQGNARQGLFALAMAGFVKWLALQDFEKIRVVLNEKGVELRDKAIKYLPKGHAKSPDNIASLFIGFDMFLDYAIYSGALTAEEAEKHRSEGWLSYPQSAKNNQNIRITKTLPIVLLILSVPHYHQDTRILPELTIMRPMKTWVTWAAWGGGVQKNISYHRGI